MRRPTRPDREQETPSRVREPKPAEPVPAPTARPRTAAEVLALQRAIGNEAVAAVLAESPVAQRSTAQQVLDGSGKPLDAPVRAEMEARLGADFSSVRVHTGAAAEQSATALGARAYTSGENIVLGAGGGDRHTLAHELSHVIQQRSGPVSGTDNGAGLSVSDPTDAFERAAEESARRALDGPVPATAEPPHVDHVAGGHGQQVQLANIANIQDGLDATQTAKIDAWLKDEQLAVPVKLPAPISTATRGQGERANRTMDTRLQVDDSTAVITWDELLLGKDITMVYDTRDVHVHPHSGPALGSAMDDLFEQMNDPFVSGDPDLNSFTTALMDWLVRKRSNTSGKLTVVTTPPEGGTKGRVTIEGRPGWDTQANQIATTGSENRRHIIAWHTMRQAFQNILNAALNAEGVDVTVRMSRLVDVLEQAGNPPSPAEGTTSEGAASADDTAGLPDIGALSLTTPAPDTASMTPAQLSLKLSAAVKTVLDLMSNNPFNLWAGHGITNQAINRVRWQLSSRLDKFSDDNELIDDVRARANTAASTPNQDRAVWTEVRDTLVDVTAGDARTIIQSIIDSFDIDLPLTGDDPASRTYDRSKPDQRAAVRNILVGQLAQEVLAMADDPLPTDFDALVTKMESWLTRFLRPETLQTTLTGEIRTVSAKP